MKSKLITWLTFAWLLLLLAASAQARVWTDRTGNKTKGDLAGVKNGQVVLRRGKQVLYYDFVGFTLDDRDYIRDEFLKRRQPQLLRELLKFAAVRRPGGTQLTELYGLPIPSRELQQDDEPRTWTDLFGQEVIGTFQRVVAPANIKLTDNNRRTQTFPIVNFVREDFEYIKQLLKTDWEREVFPATGSEPLTGEQQAQGYRTWTDRKGVPFNGKYVRATTKEVVLESAGAEHIFPYPGFSEEDRTWISEEQKRRSEEARRAAVARQQQSAASQSNGNRFGASRPGFPGSRIGYPGSRSGYPSSRPGYPGSRIGYPGSRSGLPSSRLGSSYGSSSGLPTYSFKCDTCGRAWTYVVHFS